MPIRELTHGTQVDLVLLVQQVERRPRKDGRDFLKVAFSDRTGVLSSVIWDDVDEIESLLVVGAPFRIGGLFEVHEKFGAQLRLEGFSPAVDGSYDPNDLRAGPPVPVPELERRLRALIASVQDPGMAAVLAATLGEGTDTWARYREAPAAKRVHQAYRHGLLEHCLTVAEAVAGAAAIFPGIDRDLAVTAALIHDIGKLDAYAFGDGDVVELTDAGKLRGEIVIGYERMHGVLNGIEGIDEIRKQAFLHIILAHHGKLEHGSPVTPQTREAFLVHSMDNLGGKLGTVDRMEQERQPGTAWSGFDRAFGGSVWFADAAEAPEPAAATGAPWLAHPNVAPQSPPTLPSAPVVPSGSGDAPQGPPTAHGAPAFTEPESTGTPAAPADPVVPRVAFEDSPAWNPPEPEALTGPPVPTDALTAVPDHDDDPFVPADLAAPSGSAGPAAAPEARDAAAPDPAAPWSEGGTDDIGGAPAPPTASESSGVEWEPAALEPVEGDDTGAQHPDSSERVAPLGDPRAETPEAPAAPPVVDAAAAKQAEREATAAARAAAFDTPGRPTPERSEDDLATTSEDRRRGGPPPPPDVQPLPF